MALTEKDRYLIEEAGTTRTDHNYIDYLCRQAESEEARAELEEMSHRAFVAEKIAGDLDPDDY